MLKVEAVSRRYVKRMALRNVSFEAGKNEIIALMGRNGAGKSTLMNILTGYLAMTEGRAEIDGFDVQHEPLKARRLVGYLPEQPPLYPDLTVKEYLSYCACLKGIERRRKKAEIDRVIEKTALEEYAGRLSGRLSKGYRQRLGMAQALLGSPVLLILDEPGSGLDPLQMVQMRELIVSAGRECTVLLSSHMLSEVTDVCHRALVLEKGELRYDGSMQELLAGEHRLYVVFAGGNGVHEALGRIEGVLSVQPEGEGWVVCCRPDCDLREAVSHTVYACGAALLELTPRRTGLENAFLRLLAQEVEE